MVESGLNGSSLPVMSTPPVPIHALFRIVLSSSPIAASICSPLNGSQETSASNPAALASSMFLMICALKGATKKNVNALSIRV